MNRRRQTNIQPQNVVLFSSRKCRLGFVLRQNSFLHIDHIIETMLEVLSIFVFSCVASNIHICHIYYRKKREQHLITIKVYTCVFFFFFIVVEYFNILSGNRAISLLHNSLHFTENSLNNACIQ
jgi:hypothetical protein